MKLKLEDDYKGSINNMEMSGTISPNTALIIYFVMPIVIGVILSDYMDINVSIVIQEHIGLFRFLEDAGINIKTKSMIFLIYLLFTPFAWNYYSEHRRRTKSYAHAALQKTSTSRLLLVVAGVLVLLIVEILVFYIGPNQSALSTPSHSIRVLLASSHWDISFGIFVGFMLMAFVGFLFGTIIGTKEIFIRLNN